MGKALEMIMSEPWLITEEALGTILTIAQRLNESPEAVSQKLGRPLDNSRTAEIRGRTAIIPITGPIFRYANLFTEISGATSLEVVARDFGAALENPAVDSIVLNIDSPGGHAAGISEFAAMVHASDKPVIAYAGDTAASAAYWIGSAASEFVASDTAILGSIGVVTSYRPSDNAEIKIISSQSPLKQADPNTDAGKSEIQRVIDDLASVFISSVAKYRGVSEDTVMQDFGRGGVLVGAKAIAVGMADSIGSFESVLAGLSGPSTTTRGAIMATATNQAPEITQTYISEHYPAIAEAFRKEGETKALSELDAMLADERKEAEAAGAKKELERIKSVEDQLITGHEKIITEMKYDGKSTGADAAMAVLAAEKKIRVKASEDFENETPDPVKPAHETSEKIDGNLPIEARCKAQWDNDPDLRADFGNDYDRYFAYAQAMESGRVRQIGGKK